MREVWARIEAVLLVTAPDQLASLPGGATPEAIRAVENQLGVVLPPDVCESYAIHDGSGEVGVPCELYGLIGVAIHSLNEIVREWRMWQEWCRQWGRDGNSQIPASLEGLVKADRYNPRWLPVTWDGGGVNLCIDLDPAADGVPGQVIGLDHLAPRCVVAEGWRAFLVRYAESSESGRLRFEAGELIAAAEDAEYSAALTGLIAEATHAEPGATPTAAVAPTLGRSFPVGSG